MNLDQEISSAADRYLSGAPDRLSDSIRYSLLAPGKRIRPRLALASGTLLSLKSSATLPIAIAVEMIHCFTLIHDDLPCMDNDDLRRGKPTNHKVYGESLALLAGDALLTMAFEVLSEAAAHTQANHFVNGLRRLLYCAGPRGVAGGQALEMTLGDQAALDRLEQVHRAKTGALFEAAILVPMDLAGLEANCAQGKALTHFASALGYGFQIADDLDDLAQDTAHSKTGAPPPTNIVYFKSAQDAARDAHRLLDSSARALAEQFPSTSAPLVSVAHEVLGKLPC